MGNSPIGLSAASFLGLVGVLVSVTVLSKVTRKVLLGSCCSVGKALMISVVVFVGACHC